MLSKLLYGIKTSYILGWLDDPVRAEHHYDGSTAVSTQIQHPFAGWSDDQYIKGNR